MWSSDEVPPEFSEGEKLQRLLEDAISCLDQETRSSFELGGLSPASLKTLYGFAYRFYRDGHYDKARDFFRFLVLIQSEDKKHWMGLGGAEQMCENYSPALQAYAFATVLDPTDPMPHFHAAECYARLEQWEQAHKALAACEHYIPDTAKSRPLLARIHLMRQNWPEIRSA
jgi:type III secretion system low calcium response chaperone LcrH/SycD